MKAQIVAAQWVHIVDLGSPWKPIELRPCVIVVGKSFTWAEDSRGKRHLFGASGFYTRKGAVIKKMSALNEIAMNPYLAYKHSYRAASAMQCLRRYEKGEIVL